MNDLLKLMQLAQINYDHKKQTLENIVQRERVLRSELQRLSEMASISMGEDNVFGQMRMIGADVVWQTWLAKTRIELNQRLARVLAQKVQEQEMVRVAFGKLIATESLTEVKMKSREKRKLQVAQAQWIQTALDEPDRSEG